MSVNGMRQVVEEVGSSTVDQSICLMADIKLAQFALLKSSLSNTLLAGFNFGESKGETLVCLSLQLTYDDQKDEIKG